MPNVLLSAGEFTFEDKRSKFIAYCEHAATEETARAAVNRARDMHKTASHHVYAYGLTEGHALRHSDDGEPQGTAGLPVLNAFIKRDVTDFVCVVVRYFGGTLLGTGGLTRAYGRAAKGALDAAGYAPFIRTTDYTVVCMYPNRDAMLYFFEKNGIMLRHIIYGEYCEAAVTVPEAAENLFLQNGLYIIKE